MFSKSPAGSYFIVEFVAEGLKEMVWHLFTWEGKIEPLEPQELVDVYEEQLKLASKSLEKRK
jgi:predicted DNA-binding transcriptional regulator YafY